MGPFPVVFSQKKTWSFLTWTGLVSMMIPGSCNMVLWWKFKTLTSNLRLFFETLNLNWPWNLDIVGFLPPNHPFVHRVFHYFHHPFWGSPIFGNTHIGEGTDLFSQTNPVAISVFVQALTEEQAAVEVRERINYYQKAGLVQLRGITWWWFQIFFIFIPIWGRCPIWLIFFKWVETTN